MKRKLHAIDFTLVATLLTALGGCPVAGCKSAGSFTPEQLDSIDRVGAAVTKTARDNNVTAFAHFTLEPVEFFMKQSVGAQGLRGEVFIFANPAANNEEQVATLDELIQHMLTDPGMGEKLVSIMNNAELSVEDRKAQLACAVQEWAESHQVRKAPDQPTFQPPAITLPQSGAKKSQSQV